jgi:NAD(P)-dependent dehydrogenase (short-subunit alcohol dehydrogenase family)
MGSVDEVVAEIEGSGGTAIGVACDVGDKAQIGAMIQAAVDKFGTLDILVNNAQSFGTPEAPEGTPLPKPLETYPEAEWDNIINTGLKGTFLCMQAAFPHMKDRGGRILNMASGNGIRGHEGTVAYNAAKEGIRAVTRTAAREWGQYGITVNVIMPAIVTESSSEFIAAMSPALLASLGRNPLGRMGDAKIDAGGLAVFLCSDGAGAFMTGKTLELDGGSTIRP